MTRPRRILGIGGGIGASGPGSRLDECVLELTGRDRPKVLYLPTPAADADPNVVNFYDRFAGRAAYRVELVQGTVRETTLPVRLLA